MISITPGMTPRIHGAPGLPGRHSTPMRIARCTFLALAVFTIPGARAQTPTDAGGLQQQQQRTLEYYELQKRLGERPTDDGGLIDDQTTKPAVPKAPAAEARVRVNKVTTNASQILTPAEIEAITSTLVDRDVTIKELFEAVAAINESYKAKGCATCQAFLPPQKVAGGIVEIRLVEGALSAVRVEGANYIREGFILDRIHARPGEVLDVKALEKDLAFINNTNDFKTAASLKPGASFGTVDAVIRALEPPRFGLTLFGDNAGRDETGRNRTGLIFNARSVFGVSDPLTISASGSEGALAGSVGYSLPVNRWGTRIGMQYDSSAIDIRSGPFAKLDITGTASNAGLTLTQPLIAENQLRLNVFGGYNTKDSITKFAGSPITRADTRAFSLGFDAQRFTGQGFWYTRQVVTSGTTSYAGDSDFIKYNADALWTENFRGGVTTVVRGSFQLSNEPRLPTFEQFFLGGMATVRGYPEGLLIGARGYFVSGELQFPLLGGRAASPGAPAGSDRLRGVMFIDHGGVIPGGITGSHFGWTDTLTSAGTGLLYNFSRYLNGRVMLGFPLAERGTAPRDWVAHVYVQAILF